MVGVRAIITAFPSARGLSAHPSRMMRPASGTEEGDMPGGYHRRAGRSGGETPRPRDTGEPIMLRLSLGDVRRLRTFGTLGDLERDLVSFLQAPESVAHDRAVVHEHIGTALALDEPEPLRLVEPLHSACFRHEDSTLLLAGQHLRRYRADDRDRARGPHRRDPRLG